MIPIDGAAAGIAVLIGDADSVMEVAIDYMRKHFFQDLIIPGRSDIPPGFERIGFREVAALVHQVGVPL